MCLKKNAFSYVCWALMLLFMGAIIAFWSSIASEMWAKGSIFATIGFVLGFFIIAFLVYLLTGILLKHCKTLNTDYLNENTSIVEELIIVCLLMVVFFTVRIYLMSIVTIDTSYFDIAKVTESGDVTIQFVQGSAYYYSMLLHVVFKLFGNHLILGVWLQVILQAAGSLLLYYAVRQLIGRIVALLLLVVLCLSSTAIDAGLTYSPQMLYLCIFALAFCLCTDYLKRSCTNDNSVYKWIYTVIVGFAIGFTCYVDITGVLLFVLLLSICMVDREPGNASLWYLRFMAIIGSAAAMFFAMIFVDSLLSGSTFMRVLHAWWVVYSDVGLHLEALTVEHSREFLLLPIFASLGIFSFWRRKDSQRFATGILLVVGMAVLYFCGVTGQHMDGGYLLFIFMIMLVGISVSELFCISDITVDEADCEEILTEADMHNSGSNSTEYLPVIETKSEERVENNLLKKEQPQKDDNKIENPLPVPKKKERKAMDYAFQPKMSQMMFDIRVSDKDDFDI